jgi:hypothetical protein
MTDSRKPSRGERPEWIDSLIHPVRPEWILYDGDTQRLRLGKARNQKEAIKMALERNIIPRQTDDVRPRKGSGREKIMSPEEFENFIQKLKN